MKPFVVNLPLVNVRVPVIDVLALIVSPALLFKVILLAAVRAAPVTCADGTMLLKV